MKKSTGEFFILFQYMDHNEDDYGVESSKLTKEHKDGTMDECLVDSEITLTDDKGFSYKAKVIEVNGTKPRLVMKCDTLQKQKQNQDITGEKCTKSLRSGRTIFKNIKNLPSDDESDESVVPPAKKARQEKSKEKVAIRKKMVTDIRNIMKQRTLNQKASAFSKINNTESKENAKSSHDTMIYSIEFTENEKQSSIAAPEQPQQTEKPVESQQADEQQFSKIIMCLTEDLQVARCERDVALEEIRELQQKLSLSEADNAEAKLLIISLQSQIITSLELQKSLGVLSKLVAVLTEQEMEDEAETCVRNIEVELQNEPCSIGLERSVEDKVIIVEDSVDCKSIPCKKPEGKNAKIAEEFDVEVQSTEGDEDKKNKEARNVEEESDTENEDSGKNVIETKDGMTEGKKENKNKKEKKTRKKIMYDTSHYDDEDLVESEKQLKHTKEGDKVEFLNSVDTKNDNKLVLKVLVNKEKLQAAKRATCNPTQLIRLILPEIFTLKACRNCSAFGTSKGAKRGEPTRPQLHQPAVADLLDFVKAEGVRKHWDEKKLTNPKLNHDLNNVLNEFRPKP